MARCENCGLELEPDEGFEVVGTQGKWRGRRLNFCDAQCMIDWDCGGNDPSFKGNQGFNLEKDLDKLRPRGRAR